MAPNGLGWVFLSAGALLQIGALLTLRRPVRLLRAGGTARGVIVDSNVSMHAGSRGHPHEFSFPIVEFTTRDGQTIHFTSDTGRRVAQPKGRVVRVLYDPARPHDALIASFATIGMFPLVIAAFGMPFLLAGLAVLR